MKYLGIAAILILGFLLAGCTSSGNGTNYANASPSPNVSVTPIQEYSEENIAFPTIEEESGFEGGYTGN